MAAKGTIGDIRKKVAKIYELISTAAHEAGHSVFALLHFMPVQSVSIFEHKKFKRIHGLTLYNPPDLESIKDSELYQLLLINEIKLSYAGLVAEKHHFKCISGSDKFPMFLKDGSSEDILVSANLIKKYNLVPPGRKRYNFKQKLIRETLHELQEHWDAVIVISHALFKHKKLTFEDLYSLLTKKTQNKKFWVEQFKQIQFIAENAGNLDENYLRNILIPN